MTNGDFYSLVFISIQRLSFNGISLFRYYRFLLRVCFSFLPDGEFQFLLTCILTIRSRAGLSCYVRRFRQPKWKQTNVCMYMHAK